MLSLACSVPADTESPSERAGDPLQHRQTPGSHPGTVPKTNPDPRAQQSPAPGGQDTTLSTQNLLRGPPKAPR